MKRTGLAIVTCKNGVEMTKACVQSLLKQIHPCNLLLVDNQSTDSTPQYLRSTAALCPTRSVHTITYYEEVSVSRMWNEALRWAWGMGYTEALVVNNDTELHPETYYNLTGTLAVQPDLGMVTCVSVRNPEEVVCTPPFTQRLHPDFSCFLITRGCWEKVGGFDERTRGGYVEDCLFHVKAHRLGVRLVSIGLPFLHHSCGALKHADPDARKRMEENAAHNRELFYREYGCYPGTKGYEGLFTEEEFGSALPTAPTCSAPPSTSPTPL